MPAKAPRELKDDAVLRSGEVVEGRYRVDRFIAEGGMAAVWAGTNLRTGKRVALKVILRAFATNVGAAELFRREALAASKVNHPNVVNVFDVIDHRGMACIVMELLEGETFADYLTERGPLSPQTAGALLVPAMRGVAAANAQGVVHRDLKPGNIFLCKDPDGRLLNTKVLDFGLSVMAERALSPTPRSADQFVRFGTPAYMAPEDISYSPTVDARTDVYGFGVILFQALTGQLPFPGEPTPELLNQILTVAPPKVTDVRPDLPAAMADIIDRALAKRPGDRFPDMDHLIRAAEDHLMPRLPVTRSLSSIAGVSMLPVASSKALLPVLAAAPPQSVPNPAARSAPVARTRRVLDWRIGLSVLLAAGLVMEAWPARRPEALPPPPESIAKPIAKPGSAAVEPAPLSLPAVASPLPEMPKEPRKEARNEAPTTTPAETRVAKPRAPSPRPRIKPAARPGLRPPAPQRPPLAPRPAPRAGRLTPTDF